MSFNNSFTAVTGATYTAAQYNTHVRDNFTAVWVYTTTGDIAYATTATSLARLGIGTAGQILMSNGSAPTWQSGERYAPIGINADVALTTGDYQGWMMVPPGLAGWNVTFVGAMRRSGTGVPSFQFRNVTQGWDICTTNVTIDSGETTSGTAATPPVINTSNDNVSAYDILAVDVDAAGTSSLYCTFVGGFTKP